MLQDPNVERYVSERLEPLEDQIKMLQAEMFKLMQAKNLHLQNVRLSLHNCDAEVTKQADILDIPEGQDQYTHDTAFIKGAIWMRERIADYLGEQ
jgi:hypothetical protein